MPHLHNMTAKLHDYFGLLIDMLHEAFCNTISKDQYAEIVKHISLYTNMREKLTPDDKCSLGEQQNLILSIRQWPHDYDPASHVQTLRYACTFGEPSTTMAGHLNKLQDLLCTQT